MTTAGHMCFQFLFQAKLKGILQEKRIGLVSVKHPASKMLMMGPYLYLPERQMNLQVKLIIGVNNTLNNTWCYGMKTPKLTYFSNTCRRKCTCRKDKNSYVQGNHFFTDGYA
jgi:hypothetical protein